MKEIIAIIGLTIIISGMFLIMNEIGKVRQENALLKHRLNLTQGVIWQMIGQGDYHNLVISEFDLTDWLNLLDEHGSTTRKLVLDEWKMKLGSGGVMRYTEEARSHGVLLATSSDEFPDGSRLIWSR